MLSMCNIYNQDRFFSSLTVLAKKKLKGCFGRLRDRRSGRPRRVAGTSRFRSLGKGKRFIRQ